MKKTTKTTYHHGTLHAALIKAAVSLIRIKGPNAISLREVAKKAGVSHTAPYRHFKDKNALLAAIATEGFRKLANAMQKVVSQHESDTKQQFLSAGVAYVDLALQHTEMTQLMFGGYIDMTNGPQELCAESALAFQGLLRIIENGQQAGVLKPGNTEELALAAWSIAHGFAMLVAGQQLMELVKSKKVHEFSVRLGEMLFDGVANNK